MKVQLIIDVPEGKHCWRNDNSKYPCYYLVNMGGWSKCGLKSLVSPALKEDDIGPLKSAECAGLPVVEEE